MGLGAHILNSPERFVFFADESHLEAESLLSSENVDIIFLNLLYKDMGMRDLNILILAAGRGSRLGSATQEKPKCLVEIFGRPLLDHLLEIISNGSVKEIGLVTGYQKNKFDTYPQLRKVHNAHWNSTSMLGSARLGLSEIKNDSDTLLIYSDGLLNKEAWKTIVDSFLSEKDVFCPSYSGWEALWTKRMESPLSDLESFRKQGDRIIEIGQRPFSLSEIEGQFMGVVGIPSSKREIFLNILNDYQVERGKVSSESMTDFLNYYINKGNRIGTAEIEGHWIEVDSQFDLEYYSANYEMSESDGLRGK